MTKVGRNAACRTKNILWLYTCNTMQYAGHGRSQRSFPNKEVCEPNSGALILANHANGRVRAVDASIDRGCREGGMWKGCPLSTGEESGE